MTTKQHDFSSLIEWTGNRGQGTQSYQGYDRTWRIQTPGKPEIQCSNDPLLGGDPTLHNPEDLLLSAVSACHMLWFLHLASSAKVVVSAYRDSPLGHGESEPNGAGRFKGITLRPHISLENAVDQEKADAIHDDIHQYCFIARSLNCPVSIEATYS